MNDDQIFMGIDPGLATIGYAFLSWDGALANVLDFGVITTPAGLELSERLHMLSGDLRRLLEIYDPDKVAVEELFFGTNAKTAIDVAHARGVILSLIAESGSSCSVFTPNQIKLSVTGDGRADKRQIQEMIARQFHLSEIPQPDDAADALAIAYTLALHERA